MRFKDVKPRTADQPAPTHAAGESVRCWCGEETFEPLGLSYLRCAGCGTVIDPEPVDPEERVASDGFYGDHYWRRHVPQVLGLPGLEERARSDLPERAIFHLVKILERLAPGKRVLELGCGAGSLTYLLGQAGFDARGLELGTAAIEVARARFGITVDRGPLEEQDGLGRFDAIVAVDVLEHLPRPLATMALCRRRLGPGGLLFLQTPCYRGEGPEWPMLLPNEHLYLFTETSVERMLRQAGFDAVEVGGSLFPHDMWVTAALAKPATGTPVERDDPLAGVSPVAVALIDAYAERVRAADERAALDADRGRKEEHNQCLRGELEVVRADQAAKGELLGRQDRELRRIRDDQHAKGELIDQLGADLETVRHDQAAKQVLIERLSCELASVREDQTAKASLIEVLSADLESVREDRAAKADLIEALSAKLESVREDQTAKASLIDALSTELMSVREDQTAKAELIDVVSIELKAVRADQQAKERVIRDFDAELESVRADRDKLRADRDKLRADRDRSRAETDEIRAELDHIHDDRLYRLLRALRAHFGGRP